MDAREGDIESSGCAPPPLPARASLNFAITAQSIAQTLTAAAPGIRAHSDETRNASSYPAYAIHAATRSGQQKSRPHARTAF
jgi:hypothetical protein